MAYKDPKKICYNCKYAGDRFKVNNLTHMHCEGPQYPKDKLKAGEISPWETLREFWDSCQNHEPKDQSNG